MRYRLLATAALAAAVCLGVGIGWLVWAHDSEGGANEATAAIANTVACTNRRAARLPHRHRHPSPEP